MRSILKKGIAGAAVLATVGLLTPGIAGAAVSSGSVTPTPGGSPTPNNSNTSFQMQLPSGAACPGDSNGSLSGRSYKVQSFIVPTSVDLSTLSFQANGAPAAGSARGSLANNAGGGFVRNLLTDTATPPAVTGNISGLPNFTLGVYPANFFPDGSYYVGLACNYDADTTTGSVNYWAKTITITNTGSTTNGPGQFVWQNGAVPTAPAITSVAPGDGTLDVAFTPPASADPAVTGYTLSATPTGGGATVTVTGTGSPLTIGGLTNGTAYNLSLTASNTVGQSPAATSTGTPSPAPRPPVTGLGAVPGTGKVGLAWTAPTGVAPTGYNVVITPTSPAGAALPTVTLPAGTTSYSATGLTAGTTYSFSVTPLHPAPYTAPAATVSSTPLASQVLIQDITVTRPNGALVLTQVCGAYGALPAETAQLGFPSGLTSAPAVNSSTVAAPNLPNAGIPTGENGTSYGQYPYPTNPDGTPSPTYPTRCGISLGNAQFVRNGAGAGQFFAASGRLNQVTVVDTRDTDIGWNVVGQVSNFTAGGSKSFSGSQLGWTPVNTEDTGPFTDSTGVTYDQLTAPGAAIAPNTPLASGLSSNRTLISAPAFNGTGAVKTGGLGTAIADARLKLLIPVTAQSGTYTATLTISTF